MRRALGIQRIAIGAGLMVVSVGAFALGSALSDMVRPAPKIAMHISPPRTPTASAPATVSSAKPLAPLELGQPQPSGPINDTVAAGQPDPSRMAPVPQAPNEQSASSVERRASARQDAARHWQAAGAADQPATREKENSVPAAVVAAAPAPSREASARAIAPALSPAASARPQTPSVAPPAVPAQPASIAGKSPEQLAAALDAALSESAATDALAILEQMAEGSMSRGDYAAAQKAYNDALSIAHSRQLSEVRADQYANLGRLHWKKGDKSEAEAYWRAARDQYEQFELSAKVAEMNALLRQASPTAGNSASRPTQSGKRTTSIITLQ